MPFAKPLSVLTGSLASLNQKKKTTQFYEFFVGEMCGYEFSGRSSGIFIVPDVSRRGL